ncbi:TraU family protein [uncultured Cocleimonas sp.]|uniref:TraU family protein n=1 Tax=uncultured Cocleimonas sp. TaxID=1051587 RepID=UPI002611E01B|nr:TraU family protein [uncultured Cocleimonas sp.]
MRKNNKLLAFIIYIALINPFVNVNVQAETFSGIDVIADAHTFECLDYEIIMPICIYLLIIVTPFGVYFKWYFRDRINHNLPDLVVTSFKTPGQTPFTDIRSTESKAAMEIFNSSSMRSAFDDHALGGGEVLNGHVGRQSSNTVKNNRMFEANVIGSPAPKVIRKTMKYGVPAILGKQFICKSNVKRYKPYFMSEADAIAWRRGELNPHASIYITGAREIGSLSVSNPTGNTWGKVHPRIGFVLQTEPAKAAAVIAQRSIDIVTQKNQVPHVYQSYGTSEGEVNYIPTEVDESNCENGGFGEYSQDPNCVAEYNNDTSEYSDSYDTLEEACPTTCYGASASATQMPAGDEKRKAWQMLVPEPSDQCEAFGTDDKDWPKNKNNEEGEYGWNYWREYECCKPAPGILLNP